MEDLKTLGEIRKRVKKLPPRSKLIALTLVESGHEETTPENLRDVAYVLQKALALTEGGRLLLLDYLRTEVEEVTEVVDPAGDGNPDAPTPPGEPHNGEIGTTVEPDPEPPVDDDVNAPNPGEGWDLQ